jgi:hypothetical protein
MTILTLEDLAEQIDVVQAELDVLRAMLEARDAAAPRPPAASTVDTQA